MCALESFIKKKKKVEPQPQDFTDKRKNVDCT